jgi:hypothetical protein
MKKYYFFFLLLLFWGLGGFSAWAQQSVKLISEDFNNSEVKFSVSLGAATSTWVFVEYTTPPSHSPANMSRATFTSVSFNPTGAGATVTGEPRGFWLTESATVTATLENAPDQFSWCAYALSPPPNARVKAGGGYTLLGTQPFTIVTNNGTFTVDSDELGAGTCITSITDFTYNPAGFLHDPLLTVTANAPTPVCAGTITFTASASGGITDAMSYTWSIAGAETTTTSDNPYITTLATTGDADTYTYTVFVTNANGCTSTVSNTGTVTVYVVPVVEDVSSATICSGMSATLSANVTDVTPSATYTWYVEGYPAETTTTSTYTTPALTATATTYISYTVQITNDTGCTSTVSDAGTITVNPLPEPAFVSPPTEACPNSEVWFTASDAGGASSSYCFTYQCPECLRNPFLTGEDVPPAAHCRWNSECTYTTANTYSVILPDSGSMTVWLQAMNQYGCTASTATNTEVLSPMSVRIAPAATSTGAGANVTLTASPAGAVSYQWTTGEATESITVQAPVETGVTADYSVTVTICGFSGTATASVSACGATMTSAPATENQTVSQDLPIVNITYTTAGVDAAVENLPSGVIYSWANNTLTISGTPTASGTFVYMVKMCSSVVAATGTITVVPLDTWVYGSRSYSVALRYPASGCTATSTLSTANPPPAQYKIGEDRFGYYYNWTCVKAGEKELCPDPWRVPSRSDFQTLYNNATREDLVADWGLPGYWLGDSLRETYRGFLWAIDGNCGTGGYYFWYGTDGWSYTGCFIPQNCWSVRCVR